MPLWLKHKFEKEYGKKKGDRIFYGWENKHMNHERMESMKKQRLENMKRSSAKLVLTGNKRRINYMYHHLLKEHPKTKGHLFRM